MFLVPGSTLTPQMSLTQSITPVNPGEWTFIATLGPTLVNGLNAGINENVLAYFDPADGPPTIVINSGGLSYTVTATGYLENCFVTGCPAITH
jgi:hypothetical protein